MLLNSPNVSTPVDANCSHPELITRAISVCRSMNNPLAFRVNASASMRSGNNTHNLSSEGLAVNYEIAYAWPSVEKNKNRKN